MTTMVNQLTLRIGLWVRVFATVAFVCLHPAPALAQTSQEVTFVNPPAASIPLGTAPFTVRATGGGSGNAITFNSLSSDVCAVAPVNGTTATVTPLQVGQCLIQAVQAGNANYSMGSNATNIPIVAPTVLPQATNGGTTFETASATITLSGAGNWQFAETTKGFRRLSDVPAEEILNFPAMYVEATQYLVYLTLFGVTPGSDAILTFDLPGPAMEGITLKKWARTSLNGPRELRDIPYTFSANRRQLQVVLTDGEFGDDDMTANGVIIDPLVFLLPAAAGATAIPTLSSGGLALMALLTAGLAARRLRRRA